MGLGFFRGNPGGHSAVEHQGILPGFNSQIWVAPNDGVGVLAFTNGASNAMMWMPFEFGRLLGELLGVPAEGIRADVPQHPEIWGDICGWYKLSAPMMDLHSRSMFGAGAEVFVQHGRLMFRFLNPMPMLYRGFPLHADDDKDPYVFRIDFSKFGMGTNRVVFSRDSGGGKTALYLDFMPVSLHKQPANTNPRLWITGALGLVTVATAAGLVRRTIVPQMRQRSSHPKYACAGGARRHTVSGGKR